MFAINVDIFYLDTTQSITSWALREPNKEKIENCALINGQLNYTLQNEICAIPHGFLCQNGQFSINWLCTHKLF